MAGQSASSPCLARASRWAPVSSCCCSCCLRTKAWGGHYVVSQNFLCWSCILITKKNERSKNVPLNLNYLATERHALNLLQLLFFTPAPEQTTQPKPVWLISSHACSSFQVCQCFHTWRFHSLYSSGRVRTDMAWYGLIWHDLRFSDFTPTTVIPHKITGESSQPRRESAHAAPCSFGIANAVGHAQRWLLVCWV